MRSFKACAAILFALSVVGPACAEDEVQKSETEFFVQTSGGNSEVCGLDYTIMYIDHTYRHGDLAGVRGSLSWMEGNGSINTILIIKGFNLNATSPIPFPVFQGFVIVDGKSVLPDRVGNSCTGEPTDFCGAYSSEKTFALLDALAKKKRLAIGFNRQASGAFDTTLPLKIESNSNLASTLDFGDCMLALFDRAKANRPNK